MKSKRLVTYKCGHEEEIELYTTKKGKDGRSFLDWSFDNLKHCDCEKCKRENGAKSQMFINFDDGKFIASIGNNLYNYKDILKECGMRYDSTYGWYYSFNNKNYKELLDKKIEILKEHKIVVTKVIEDGNLEEEERKYYKSLSIQKLRDSIMEIIPNDMDKNSEEYNTYRETLKKEISRISTLSIDELKNYEFNPNSEDDEEVKEKIAKKELLNNLKKEAIKEVEEKILTPRPAFADEGYWNQKVYGAKGNRSIYIGREKRSITEEEYEQWNAYVNSIDEFRRIRVLILGMSIEQLQNKEYLIEIEGNEIRENATLEIKRDILRDKPSCINGYWNGRFYGKNEREIYIDSKKRTLSDEEYQSIQDYQNSIKKYNEIVKKLENMSLSDLRSKEYKKLYA